MPLHPGWAFFLLMLPKLLRSFVALACLVSGRRLVLPGRRPLPTATPGQELLPNCAAYDQLRAVRACSVLEIDQAALEAGSFSSRLAFEARSPRWRCLMCYRPTHEPLMARPEWPQ